MQYKKISDFPNITTVGSGVYLPAVDPSESLAINQNKKIRVADFLDNYQGFTQSGTGAVSRTITSKLRDVVSVKDFGAVGDGVADDTAAIQAAIDYVASNPYAGGKVTFDGQGLYKFSNLTFPADTSGNTNGGVILDGNGCRMVKTSADGIGVLVQGAPGGRPQRRQNSLIRNIVFSVATVQTGGAMIQVLNSEHTYLENIEIESAATGIAVVDSFDTRLTNIYIRNSVFKDIYVYGSSGLSTVETIISKVVGEGVTGNTTKIGLAIDSGVTGVYVDTCDFVHGTKGVSIIHTAQPEPNYRPEWLFFNTVLSDTIGTLGWEVAGDVEGVFLDNCWASTCGLSGFAFNAGSQVSLANCIALNNGQHGLSFTGTVADFSIRGGLFACNSTTSPSTYNGISIGPGVSNFTIANVRSGNPPSLGLSGAQGVGIYIDTGASDNYQILGNTVTYNATSIVDNGSGINKKVSSNLGHNPVGYQSVAMPASGDAYTNGTGLDATVYVSGGTVTDVEINFKSAGWVSTGITSGPVRVPGNAAIRITYSAAPTWLWFFE